MTDRGHLRIRPGATRWLSPLTRCLRAANEELAPCYLSYCLAQPWYQSDHPRKVSAANLKNQQELPAPATSARLSLHSQGDARSGMRVINHSN